MGQTHLSHMVHSRTSIYTALEDMDFHWDLKIVAEFERMWGEGMSVTEIAEVIGRDVNEVAVLALDRRIKGEIEARPGGVFGRSVASEEARTICDRHG